MLYRNTAGYIDASMVVIATGAALSSGTVQCFVRRKSDDYWLYADSSWNAVKPTAGDIPAMTHESGGLWQLAYTPADADDAYMINCIDTGATCFPDNYSLTILPKPEYAEILTGAHKVTLQLYVTATTTPIADVFVDVYDGTNTVRLNGASLITAGNGQVEFYRNDGTYKIRLMKAGVSFEAGTVVVSGADVSSTLYGTPFTAPVPSDPGLQVLYGWVWQLDKSLVSGVKVTAQIAKQTALADAVIVNAKLEDTSDASGYFELQVLKGSRIQVLAGDSYARTFTVTNDDTKTLASY